MQVYYLGQSKHILILAMFALSQMPARAQDAASTGSSSTQQDSTDQDSNKNKKEVQDSEPYSEPIPPVQILDTTPIVRQVGRADPLGQNASRLRWGPLYISSAEYLQAYDHLSGTGATPTTSGPVSMFQTTIVLDQQSEQNRIALQYSPNIAIASGQVYSNFTSQEFSLNTSRSLTPRLTFGASNSFSAIRTENLLVDNYFSVDTLNHTALQGQFLNNAGRSIRDNVQVSLGYLLSPQASIRVASNYDYANTTNFNSTAVGNQYGTAIGLTRLMGRSDTIGLNYAFQVAQIAGQPNQYYHSFGISYSRMLTQNLAVGGSAYGAAVVPSRVNLSPTRWTWAGTAQIVRTFNKSSLGLLFTRTQDLRQVISTQYYDRLDGSYSFRWNSRLGSSAGGGYFRTVASAQQHYTAMYVHGTAQYFLTPTLSFVATFSHQRQTGDPTQVLTGTNNVIFGGLRWAALSLP